jgi:AAA domain
MLPGIVRGKATKPRRTVIYGQHGVGKSTWAARWPKPVFLCTEDGVGDLGVDRFPLCRSLADVGGPIMALTGDTPHDYQTLVIDSADWLERLIWNHVCENGGKECMADFPFGRGYNDAARRFEKLLLELDRLRNHPVRPMHVVLIAHSQVLRFESPDSESYDRYSPRLHRDVSALVQEWADEVLFATYEVFTKQTDEGFGKKRTVALGEGRRVIRTSERPSHLAKNRLGLPETMSLDFSEYAEFLSVPASANKGV